MAQHNELGKQGEQLALNYLVDHKYTILARNYTYLKAEVDIIAEKDGILAVVEVKTRTHTAFGNPQDFVKPKQIQLLVKAIDHYVNENQLNVDVRFDIIAIVKTKTDVNLEHIKNAFYCF